MKLNIHPKVIFRIPRFPLNATLEQYWENLKPLILESSKEFHNIIKDLKYHEIDHQSESVRHTIWKYFNRARNRSTPFGSFAAVGICESGHPQADEKVRISSKITAHAFVDWSLKENAEYTFEELLVKNGKLFTNSTYYRVAEYTVRYISYEESSFSISEAEADNTMLTVLSLCKHPCPLSGIIRQLPEMTGGEIQEIIETLVSLQLLFTSLDPNIIGEDYFRRIGFKAPKSAKKYIISERKHTGGLFDLRTLKNSNKLVEILSRIAQVPASSCLQQFISRFRSRYDMEEVPLMLALDPETGIGYGDFEQSMTESEAILAISRKKHTDASSVNNSVVKDYFTKMMLNNRENTSGTILLDDVMDELPAKPDLSLPSSFSLLFSIADDLVWMEHAGGATASSLAGRFTQAVDEIHRYAREIASVEQRANPDVLFFDIAYIAENRVDNVSRRKQIYDHQLTLLNYDTSDLPITLDDIMVSLSGKELILRSRSLNKRIVPRFASAYNHSRSDLSVFRLLCDLQHQGIQSNLGFRLDTLIPGLDRYPRIQYGQYVISPQKWRVSKKIFSGDKTGKSDFTQSLKAHLLDIGATQLIRAGISDQTLYFNTDNEEDLRALSHFLNKQGELLLEETALPADGILTDESGNPYTAQFLASLTNEDKVYDGIQRAECNIGIPSKLLPRNLLLGSEWLYFELYCHPHYADNLLKGVIPEFIQEFRKSIRQWFFIRYTENGNHIRLRFNLKDPSEGQQLTTALSNYLSNEIRLGTVSDMQQKIYRREVERYGTDLMEEVEAHFCLDSKYVLQLLAMEGITDMDKYRHCILLLLNVMEAGVIDKSDFERHTERVLHSFQQEHHTEANEYKLLNGIFNEFRKDDSLISPVQNSMGLLSFTHSLVRLIGLCPQVRRQRLLSDLIHMHVNRLFATYQRTHELVVYYLFQKCLKQRRALYGSPEQNN